MKLDVRVIKIKEAAELSAPVVQCELQINKGQLSETITEEYAQSIINCFKLKCAGTEQTRKGFTSYIFS